MYVCKITYVPDKEIIQFLYEWLIGLQTSILHKRYASCQQTYKFYTILVLMYGNWQYHDNNRDKTTLMDRTWIHKKLQIYKENVPYLKSHFNIWNVGYPLVHCLDCLRNTYTVRIAVADGVV